MKATGLSILILLFSLTSAASAGNLEAPSSKLITQAELMSLLPDDADRQNIKRQQKAYKKGFYWTKSKTLRPLDRKG
ncbi:hypothetical protein [Alkalimarinus coralli]|uniref:hypothetical protein n=1 Tax=Alkalimarinus coralli TaxID=2935863 RepID=UPI00202B51B6|nr:hypothetical protein [Alkalimarinus coralli]